MDASTTTGCPHFQLYIDRLTADSPHAYIAIRRCMLMEHALPLLDTTDTGAQLAAQLTIQPEDDKRYALFGPDLDPVTVHTCTGKRCESVCTPSYRHLLDQLGLSDPQEEAVTCDSAIEAPSSTERILR